ncbi:MAG: AAA family ATPase [Nanoarchaeota archaeon]|nr:AAA family ATPase [Nanoarchaeota archaeon]MBU1005244.1 AAA family ATPase [Nanoarchaeota archaeon]MBU1945789.1 AAA family ATPase [Nanoarchaeota archaeon]
MALFKDMLSSDESLFRNEQALDFAFQPKPMKYREVQQRHIAECIKPLFQARNGKNLFIYGVPGIGKTLACNQVLGEIEETTDEIVSVYINCWHKNTTFKVYLELCAILGYRLTQNKGGDELFKVIKEILNKKAVVFVFDEVDKAEDFDFLYSILEEVYKKSILLITNYKDWVLNLEERIRSRLMLDQLEFKPYNLKETEGILRQRIEYAFVPDVLEDAAFQLILKKAVELEDIRAGLTMLREAGLSAENRSSRKIIEEDAKKALEKLGESNLQSSNELEDDSKFILGIIKNHSNIKMGDLFKLYQEKGGKTSYRSFFRRVNKLADDKFVSLEKKGGGIEGNITIVKYTTVKKLSEF